MRKNIRLADIYIKIYNKKPLTMDDLAFLAKYDPECFEKTCKNLILNLPETSKLMQPEKKEEEKLKESDTGALAGDSKKITEECEMPAGTSTQGEGKAHTESIETEEQSGEEMIKLLLENLRKMEQQEFEIQKLDVDRVKNLLGSLYMEMLFPHNDHDRYFKMESEDNTYTFNKKA